MNIKNLWIAALSGAVLTTLVSNLPFAGFINCLLFAGFWGSAICAAWLYRRLTGSLTANQGLRVGALTGICAGGLGFILSFAGLAGLQGFINTARQILPPEAALGTDSIPIWGALVFNLLGVLCNFIFGTLGGWIGGRIFCTDRDTGK
jgi:hypothetical protein